MTRGSRRRLVGGLVGALVVLAGCTDDVPTVQGTTSTTAPATTAPPTTTTTPEPPGPDELPPDLDVVAAALLAPDHLAGLYPTTAFEDFAYQPVVDDNLCGDTIDGDHPPALVSGIQLSSEELALDVVEEVRVFHSAAEAAAAADAVVASLADCADLPDGVAVQGPVPVVDQVGGTRALRYGMVSPEGTTEFVLVEVANTTVVVSFGRAVDGGAATTTTTAPEVGLAPPDDLEVAALAVALVEDAIRGDDEGISEVEVLAPELLVTLEELAVPDLQDTGFIPPEGPNPCGADLDATNPATAVVGARFAAPDGAVLEQVIRVYGERDSEAAFAAAVAGYRCTTGVDGATAVSAPVDVTGQVGAEARLVELSAGDLTTTVVLVRVEDALVTFECACPPGAALEPTTAAAFGTGKILAALGQ